MHADDAHNVGHVHMALKWVGRPHGSRAVPASIHHQQTAYVLLNHMDLEDKRAAIQLELLASLDELLLHFHQDGPDLSQAAAYHVVLDLQRDQRLHAVI